MYIEYSYIYIYAFDISLYVCGSHGGKSIGRLGPNQIEESPRATDLAAGKVLPYGTLGKNVKMPREQNRNDGTYI